VRRFIVGLTAVLALAFTSAASGHPSEVRNERAFHGGPHCHTNLHSGKPVFPSHRAHVATGTRVFAGADCP
jgi:hypothetical protein